jgi:hypothetical protein
MAGKSATGYYKFYYNLLQTNVAVHVTLAMLVTKM